MSTTLYLARHGNRQDFVDPSWPDRADRPNDPGLSGDGIEQAKKLGRRLRSESITHLFASPYLRTVETAHYVAQELHLPIRIEPGLGEWLNPEWFSDHPELLPRRRLAQRFTGVDLDYEPVLVPEFAEDEREAEERAHRTARRLVDRYGDRILIVGHGVSVAGVAKGFRPELDRVICPVGGLTKLVQNGKEWRMPYTADVSHLATRAEADRLN